MRYVRKLRKQERNASEQTANSLIIEGRKRAREQQRLERKADRKKQRYDRQVYKENQEKLKSESDLEWEKNKDRYERQQNELRAERVREKKFRRYRRKKLLRFYFKNCFRNILLSLKTLNPRNLPRYIRYVKNNKGFIREFAVICTHSTLFFVAAYLLVFLIMIFTAAISGIFFEYSSIVYYYEVLWLVKPEQWFGDSVKMIYAAGPILCGILALFFAIIFSYLRTDRGLGKLFILWFFLHGFNAFFGSLLIGSLFGRGFGYAIIWSYISDTEKVIYSIISITALFLLGVFTSRSFLISANSYYPHLERNQKQKFIWAQVIMPFLLGNIIIGLIMFPEVLLYDMTVSLALIITIIPVAIGHRFSTGLYFEEESPGIKFKLLPILLTVIFIALYRIILGMGIMME